MENETKTTGGQQPNFKGDGVAVWVNHTKDEKPYLNIKVVGHNFIVAWENVPRIKKDTEEVKEEKVEEEIVRTEENRKI